MSILLKSKTVQLIIVLFLAASVIVTGTYAWSGFLGKTNTATPVLVPEEVTLYDFSGQFGEIYVVNNSSEAMIVRIKLVQNLLIGGAQTIPGTLSDDPFTWPSDSEYIRKFFRPVFSKAVVSVGDWKGRGAPVGDYWIADLNGWYYYAKKLAPGEATRTLITEVAHNKFNELIDGEYQTATFLQSVTRENVSDLLRIDASSFTSDGKLIMKYLNGEMVEFVNS